MTQGRLSGLIRKGHRRASHCNGFYVQLTSGIRLHLPDVFLASLLWFASNQWLLCAAGITSDRLLVRVSKAGRNWGEAMTGKVRRAHR